MRKRLHANGINKITLTGLIITLGIVYGDIGTSPLYVMRAIIGNSPVVDTNLILGAISCIFWTLTLQTTVKYIIITLRADNNGEGGIFSIYALLRRKVKWVYVFAIIGGSMLLADGIITPAITVTSAIEGLQIIDSSIPVIPIVLIILTLLFSVQQFGTKLIGESFGPIMFIWFTMLAILGTIQVAQYPMIITALNPVYAYNLLANHPHGFLLLGAVFLCTTGAEALFSDLGHCGLKNIRLTWIFVKTSLVLNYFGQGAWIISNMNTVSGDVNPFFAIMPSWFLMTGIIISAAAAIIASQALISGSYTLISEAIILNFWPKVKIKYPTTIKGQMYISSVNWMLWVGCMFVILFFQESSNMEAAYGLAITITMLMTTFLLTFYLLYHRTPVYVITLFLLVYLTIEGAFLAANLNKFIHGGWVTIFIAGVLFVVMFVWYKGRNIKKRFIEFVPFTNYIEILKDIHEDQSIPKYATNLVYLTRSRRSTDVEAKVIYSIINKQPKRADIYWFISVEVLDSPYTMEYKVTQIIPNILIRVNFKLGFKVDQRINLFFKQVVEELVRNNEVDLYSRYESLRKHNVIGDFKFIVIDRIQNYDFDFSPSEQFIMDIYANLKKIGISEVKALGLDTSNVYIETVPLLIEDFHEYKLKRIND